jgi:hypothetical protein
MDARILSRCGTHTGRMKRSKLQEDEKSCKFTPGLRVRCAVDDASGGFISNREQHQFDHDLQFAACLDPNVYEV